MKTLLIFTLISIGSLANAAEWETINRKMPARDFYRLLPATMSAEGNDPLVSFTGANKDGIVCRADILRSRYGHEITIYYKDQESWNQARKWSRLQEEYSSFEGTYEARRYHDTETGEYHIAGFYRDFGKQRGSLQLNSVDGKLTAVFITDRFNSDKRNCIAGKEPIKTDEE